MRVAEVTDEFTRGVDASSLAAKTRCGCRVMKIHVMQNYMRHWSIFVNKHIALATNSAEFRIYFNIAETMLSTLGPVSMVFK